MSNESIGNVRDLMERILYEIKRVVESVPDMSMTRDPYVLDASRVEDPPTRWAARLRMLGPGFILTACVVGSGELSGRCSRGEVRFSCGLC